MISKLLVPALTATLGLTGCSLAIGSMNAPHAVAGGSAVLRLQPVIEAGGYRGQATVNPYMAADVAVLRLTLHKVDGQGQETSVKNAQGQDLSLDVPQARLAETVQFTKLNANTLYRVKAAAYLDTQATQLISTQDASSSTDIAIFQEDQPILAKLKVQLIDKTFDGQGGSTIEISSGSLVPAGSESMTIPLDH